MTRILVMTNLYPNPYQPNRAPFNRDLVRALAARQPVALIAPILWTDEVSARWGKQAFSAANRCVVHDGLFVDHPCYFYPPRMLRHWYGHFYRWSVRDSFSRTVRRFRPDLIFAPWIYPDGWAAIHLAHQAGLPVVLMAHGSDVRSLGSYPGRHRRTLEALQGTDGIVTVSRDLAERVIRLGVPSSRVRVIYGGVDIHRFHPGPKDAARGRTGLPAEGPILLFVGNLVPVKGLDVLLDACARLRSGGVRFTACILGDGPLRSWLQRRIDQLELCSQIRLVGPRPHDELPEWYRSADLVVLPSRSEGVPTVLLEAAACGTPFVATRVGGVPEVARYGTNCLVPPENPVALAKAIAEGLQGTFADYSSGPCFRRTPDEVAAELDAFLTEVCQLRLTPRRIAT